MTELLLDVGDGLVVVTASSICAFDRTPTAARRAVPDRSRRHTACVAPSGAS
jgi:hypothetical protein